MLNMKIHERGIINNDPRVKKLNIYWIPKLYDVKTKVSKCKYIDEE